MPFSPSQQQSALSIWSEYIEPTLGSKAHKQFVRATTKPSHGFVERIIKPNLFRTDPFGAWYYPVDLDARTPGRNHYIAAAIATDPDPHAFYGGEPWPGLTYFANPPRACNPVIDEAGEEHWERPRHRVVVGDHHVFTFEFDHSTVEFLKEQLSWLSSSKNRLNCKIGELYRHCSDWGDFVGITVAYSGNKSLHIHVAFDTWLANEKLGIGDGSSLRSGLMRHWDVLRDDVVRILEPPSEIPADASLKVPESYRRLPNGSRVVERNDHVLGIPPGTIVPQVTLWEKFRERAGRSDAPLFFRPEPFQPPPSIYRAPRTNSPSRKLGPLSEGERTFCEERLREFYPNWPRFEHLTHEGGRWVAKFRNSPEDKNPSSIMREDHNRVHLQGKGSDGVRAKPLPCLLGVMLRFWVAKMKSQREEGPETSLQEIVLEPIERRDPHPLETRVRTEVTDHQSARDAMSAFFRETVSHYPLLFVSGPEGVGKTSSLIADHHVLVADLERRGDTDLAMYAFADYGTAEQKCAAFDSAQRANGFKGVVLPSFNRAYEDACRSLSMKPVTMEDAARLGYPSLWACIEHLQPRVLHEFKSRHENLWAAVGRKRPVFFTVHQVAHDWHRTTLTRRMWARDFWRLSESPEEQTEMCRQSTALGLLVHDEIKSESLVNAYPKEVIDWAESLANTDRSIWFAKSPSLPMLLKSFEAFVSATGLPSHNGQEVRLSFAEARAAVEFSMAEFDLVVTRNTSEYGVVEDERAVEPEQHCDIYGERHGSSWCVASRNWWRSAAHRVVMLTTEAVPTALARAADPDWAIFELETPRLPRDCVETYPSRSVTGRNLPTLCADYRTNHPGDNVVIVSNKVSMLADTMPHVTARGSNDLIGRNVLQTMTFMTPDEYERLQALNAWTGRSDLVGLRHIDEFNQTAGRNLGWRKRGDVKHILLVNKRLFGFLMGPVLAHSRYDFRLHLDKHQRYEIKRAAA